MANSVGRRQCSNQFLQCLWQRFYADNYEIWYLHKLRCASFANGRGIRLGPKDSRLAVLYQRFCSEIRKRIPRWHLFLCCIFKMLFAYCWRDMLAGRVRRVLDIYTLKIRISFALLLMPLSIFLVPTVGSLWDSPLNLILFQGRVQIIFSECCFMW